jgi:hypothetical protein
MILHKKNLRRHLEFWCKADEAGMDEDLLESSHVDASVPVTCVKCLKVLILKKSLPRHLEFWCKGDISPPVLLENETNINNDIIAVSK